MRARANKGGERVVQGRDTRGAGARFSERARLTFFDGVDTVKFFLNLGLFNFLYFFFSIVLNIFDF